MPDFRAYIRENLPPLGISGSDEAQIVEELALEFEENFERAVRSGLTPEEAWQDVTDRTDWLQLADGLRSSIQQCEAVDVHRPESNVFLRWTDDLRRDLRYAVRQLLKRPAFTIVTVMTLALGIGANTGIFSLVNAILLRSLPVRNPQQLLFFGTALPEGETGFLANGQAFSYPFYREFLRSNQVFSSVAAINSIMFGTYGRAGAPEPEPLKIELVSGTYFNTVGAKSFLGRILDEKDDESPGAHPVAVASYSWWQRRFGGDSSVVGRKIQIGDTVYDVVGVAQPGFFGVTVGQSPDLWIPLAMQKEISPGWNGLEDPRFQTLHLVGRMKPGVTLPQVEANTNLVARQILLQHAALRADKEEIEEIRRLQIQLTSGTAGRSRLRLRFASPLKILMIVVGLVLLIACANVANLLLTRAAARQREIAVRISLGAARSQIIRQLILESSLLACTGAFVGVGLAWSANRLLLTMVSTGSQLLPIRIAPDATVLAFTSVVTCLTVFLFGTAPAVFATRLDPAASLIGTRGAASSSTSRRLGQGFVVIQLTISLALLVSAGLFLRTLSNLMNVDVGFDKKNVLIASIEPGSAGYRVDARFQSMMRRVEENVREIPGVEGASFAYTVFDNGGFITDISVPGRDGFNSDPSVDHNIVGPDYLRVMKMPLVLGRYLDARDTAASRKVAVINETMARTYFGAGSPLGRTFGLDEPGWDDIEVVGVVRDAKYLHIDEKAMPAAFYSHSQFRKNFLYSFVVRYTGDATQIAPAVKRAVREIDPNLPVDDFRALAQVVDDAARNNRLVAQLSTFFGILATFLAAIGIYGVTSYGVTRRTGEFGIRMALGAQRGHVLWVVLRETLRLALIAAAIGLVLTRISRSLIAALLFGIDPGDPVVIAAAIFALIVVALLAGFLPARRATQIDPMTALRYE